MRERIIEFIEKEGISAAEFADKIGVQRSSVSHVLNGRNNPGFSFIQKILETYPNLNSRWLLTGTGSMDEDLTSNKLLSQPKVVPERDLFSTAVDNKSSQGQDQEEIHISADYQSNSLNKADSKPLPEEMNSQKKVTKVLIFYDDHTFEDFRPAE